VFKSLSNFKHRVASSSLNYVGLKEMLSLDNKSFIQMLLKGAHGVFIDQSVTIGILRQVMGH
jgi:hypothetical protein